MESWWWMVSVRSRHLACQGAVALRPEWFEPFRRRVTAQAES